MGKALVIILTIISSITPLILLPFSIYAEHFFLDFIFISFFSFAVNLFLSFAIRRDSIENNKSDWWKVLGFLAIFFGWFIGLIYLFTYSSGYKNRINKIKQEYENSFNEVSFNSEESYVSKENNKNFKRNSIFSTTADFSFLKNRSNSEILYYENGKPVYKKDLKLK